MVRGEGEFAVSSTSAIKGKTVDYSKIPPWCGPLEGGCLPSRRIIIWLFIVYPSPSPQTRTQRKEEGWRKVQGWVG